METREDFLSPPGKATVFRYTLKCGLWMNQIEIWLGILDRKVIRPFAKLRESWHSDAVLAIRAEGADFHQGVEALGFADESDMWPQSISLISITTDLPATQVNPYMVPLLRVPQEKWRHAIVGAVLRIMGRR
jgi:hypothetical protein